jgi:hypothetical protein
VIVQLVNVWDYGIRKNNTIFTQFVSYWEWFRVDPVTRTAPPAPGADRHSLIQRPGWCYHYAETVFMLVGSGFTINAVPGAPVGGTLVGPWAIVPPPGSELPVGLPNQRGFGMWLIPPWPWGIHYTYFNTNCCLPGAGVLRIGTAVERLSTWGMLGGGTWTGAGPSLDP